MILRSSGAFCPLRTLPCLFTLILWVSTCNAGRRSREVDGLSPQWEKIRGSRQVMETGLAFPRFPSNITGTYKGSWTLAVGNKTAQFPELKKRSGNIIFQLSSAKTDRPEVHYVLGEVVLRDGMYINDKDLHLKLEGVYVKTVGELRLIWSSLLEMDVEAEMDGQPTTLHLALPESENGLKPDHSGQDRTTLGTAAALGCKIRMFTQVSRLPWDSKSGTEDQQLSVMVGQLESTYLEEGECFATLRVNATAVDLEAYYNKAVNYTLMVTFISFLQVLFLIRQMEHSNSHSGATKVSLLMVGQQAVMDAYLCLLHLTAGIVVESLFNAFATAAFFKFVIFSIFEMRYLLAIWKARRPAAVGEGWETMRRELSILYSRFYGCLLGGILLLYQLHNILRWLLFAFYSFWIPQIVTNLIRDSRKPLHPHYILGMTATRLAVPLYAFGCPKNFMRVEPDPQWCAALVAFVVAQAGVLLLQHFFGARCFVPRQLLPEKYSYFRRVDLSTLRSTSRNSCGASCGGSGGGHGGAAGGAGCTAGEAPEEPPSVDCVICMAPVELAPRVTTERMVTPCDHFFHTGCLQRWMDIKMECPTCRRALPPM